MAFFCTADGVYILFYRQQKAHFRGLPTQFFVQPTTFRCYEELNVIYYIQFLIPQQLKMSIVPPPRKAKYKSFFQVTQDYEIQGVINGTKTYLLKHFLFYVISKLF